MTLHQFLLFANWRDDFRRKAPHALSTIERRKWRSLERDQIADESLYIWIMRWKLKPETDRIFEKIKQCKQL